MKRIAPCRTSFSSPHPPPFPQNNQKKNRRELREDAIIDNARHKLRRVLPANTFIDISTDPVPPDFLRCVVFFGVWAQHEEWDVQVQ